MNAKYLVTDSVASLLVGNLERMNVRILAFPQMNTSTDAPIKVLDKQDEDIEKAKEQLEMLKSKYLEKENVPIDQFTKGLIHKTHEYNKFKDFGQTLLGILAEREQLTVKDMYRKYDMNEDD